MSGIVKAETSVVSAAYTITLLDELFETFNTKYFESELKKPVITISQRGASNAAGWCTNSKVWEDGRKERHYEINICPENIGNVPIEYVCEVLIHEMVH